MEREGERGREMEREVREGVIERGREGGEGGDRERWRERSERER